MLIAAEATVCRLMGAARFRTLAEASTVVLIHGYLIVVLILEEVGHRGPHPGGLLIGLVVFIFEEVLY